jgi:proteasome lid subunit RPN8/RPN11
MYLRTIKVCVSRGLINEFKGEARVAFPRETFAYLLGRDAGTIVEIEELFTPMDVDEWCTETGVDISDDWLPAAKKHAREHGLKVVGDIHSHPFRYGEIGKLKPECTPSEEDIDNGMPWIVGICQVNQAKTGRLTTRVRFWGPMFPVEEHISN